MKIYTFQSFTNFHVPPTVQLKTPAAYGRVATNKFLEAISTHNFLVHKRSFITYEYPRPIIRDY